MNAKNMSFFKLVLLSAIVFLAIVLLIEFLYSLTSKESVSQIVDNMTTTNYMIRKVVSSLVYGIIITFFMKKKAKSLER